MSGKPNHTKSIDGSRIVMTDYQKKQAEMEQNKNVKSDDTKKAVYDDYQSSVKFLKAGFKATKLNYSNSKTQVVIVYLSANGQNLCYKPK